MHERYTDRARKVLSLAIEQAVIYSHPAAHSGHVLLGCLDECEGVAGQVLLNLGLGREAISPIVEAQWLTAPLAERDLMLHHTATMHCARQLQHNYAGTEHLLLALAIVPELQGARALGTTATSFAIVAQEVLNLLGHMQLSASILAAGFCPPHAAN